MFGNSGRVCGGTGGPERSGAPGLVEIVLRNGIGVGGIESVRAERLVRSASAFRRITEAKPR